MPYVPAALLFKSDVGVGVSGICLRFVLLQFAITRRCAFEGRLDPLADRIIAVVARSRSQSPLYKGKFRVMLRPVGKGNVLRATLYKDITGDNQRCLQQRHLT